MSAKMLLFAKSPTLADCKSVQLRRRLLSPPKSPPCPAAGVLLQLKLTHVSNVCVLVPNAPPDSPYSPAPTSPTRSIWVPAVHNRVSAPISE